MHSLQSEHHLLIFITSSSSYTSPKYSLDSCSAPNDNTPWTTAWTSCFLWWGLKDCLRCLCLKTNPDCWEVRSCYCFALCSGWWTIAKRGSAWVRLIFISTGKCSRCSCWAWIGCAHWLVGQCSVVAGCVAADNSSDSFVPAVVKTAPFPPVLVDNFDSDSYCFGIPAETH